MRQLDRLREGPALRGVALRYVMTDFAETNLAAWRAHPALAPWLDAGRLDLARFDAEHDRAIALERSGATLAPGGVANPVVAIANYVFDGLPLDAFSVEDGRLLEWRVRLCSTRPDTDLDDPDVLARARLTCERRPVEPAGYYGDPALDRILEEHRARLPGTSFTFPSASLACLARLSELAGGRLLVLSTDKGEVREDGLRGQAGPQLTLHGSFSVAVNYHAIARRVCDLGGEALLPADRARAIATCGFVLGAPAGGAVETRQAYAEAIEAQRPDDRFAIEQSLEPVSATLTLDRWIGYLRFTGCDPKLVADALPFLLARVGAEPPEPGVRDDLLRLLVRTWDGYFHIGEPHDLGFALGTLAAALAGWPEAIGLFEGSLRWYGRAAPTLAALARCHHRLGRHATAAALVDEALAGDPACAPALALRAELASSPP